jgi:hypothetical protein
VGHLSLAYLQIAPIGSTISTPAAAPTPPVTSGDIRNAHTHLDKHKPRKRRIGRRPNVAQRSLDSAPAHQHRTSRHRPNPSPTVPRRYPQTTKFSTTIHRWGGSIRVAAPVHRPKNNPDKSVFDQQKHSGNTQSVRNYNTVIKLGSGGALAGFARASGALVRAAARTGTR